MTTTDTGRIEITSPSIPAPRGHFSHAVSAGAFVYVSGLLALDDSGAIAGPGDIEEQTSIILDALESILVEAGSSPAGLIKLTVYVTDIEQRSTVSALRAQRWPEIRPASTLVEVSALAAEGAVIEVDAVAIH
jgi:2-iminobutanoate/2-iminopropanoate deaminase